MGHAQFGDAAGRGVSGRLPPDADVARERLPQPRDGLDELGLAVALHPSHAQHFPGAHLEGDVVHGQVVAVVQHFQRLHLQHHLARFRRRLLHFQFHVAPDHHRRQFGFRGLGGERAAHRAAQAQHGDAVGHGQHFLELVRDEDDGLALRYERAHDLEQFADLLRGQHRGRLVEDEDVGLAEEQLDDLDALLHADRQVFNVGVRVHFQPVLP